MPGGRGLRRLIAQFDEQAAWLLRAKSRQYAKAVPAFAAFTSDLAGGDGAFIHGVPSWKLDRIAMDLA